jgi:ribulose 1,5-bisphosphate synthetase/thiazole synthase
MKQVLEGVNILRHPSAKELSDLGPWDAIIVGAGLSGAVLAESFATQRNAKVLIIEKREHIGGRKTLETPWMYQ